MRLLGKFIVWRVTNMYNTLRHGSHGLCSSTALQPTRLTPGKAGWGIALGTRMEKWLEKKGWKPSWAVCWVETSAFCWGRVSKWMSSKNDLLPQQVLYPSFKVQAVPRPATSCPFTWLHLWALWSLLLRSWRLSSSWLTSAQHSGQWCLVPPDHKLI